MNDDFRSRVTGTMANPQNGDILPIATAFQRWSFINW